MICKFNGGSLFFTTLFFAYSAFAQQKNEVKNLHNLIVIFDGLRPDYITPQAMPNLYAFSQRGSYGLQHHSVYPSVTRVNSSSYATGSYPFTNGLMGNSVYFPSVDKTKGLNTGEASEMKRVDAATGGHLLTTISVGEILAKANQKMMVFSSGSSGQALFQNHTVSGGAIVNTSMILPDSFKPIIEKEIGPIPAAAKPNLPQHKWITDALIKYGLQKDGPAVSAIWFSDPDGIAHAEGIGAASTMAAIQFVDEQFGRIIAEIESKNLANYFNIIVTADHGFVTQIGKEGITDFLIKEGLKYAKESDDVVVAEGAIYVKNKDRETIKKIVTKLQAQSWIGSIFTKASKPGNLIGWVDGTVSFDAVHWNHPTRAGDILVDYNWNSDSNTNGYAGTSYSRGVAGHGGLSPYEVHIALLAAGPSFKEHYQSQLPTSNVDIVPTLLHLLHLPIPLAMEGRVMQELLIEKSKHKPVVKKESIITTANYKGGSYQLTVQRSIVDNHQYVDFSKVVRQ